MSTNDYKKRAKANWNQGKRYKGDSEERGYAKKEIVKEAKVSDENYLTPHKKKRKRNKKAALEYRIQWYTQRLLDEARISRGSDSFANWLREGLKEAKKEYEEKYSDKKEKP